MVGTSACGMNRRRHVEDAVFVCLYPGERSLGDGTSRIGISRAEEDFGEPGALIRLGVMFFRECF